MSHISLCGYRVMFAMNLIYMKCVNISALTGFRPHIIRKLRGSENRSSIDLKAEIKSLVFDANTSTGDAIIVSEDPVLFAAIMSTFQYYEGYVSKVG